MVSFSSQLFWLHIRVNNSFLSSDIVLFKMDRVLIFVWVENRRWNCGSINRSGLCIQVFPNTLHRLYKMCRRISLRCPLSCNLDYFNRVSSWLLSMTTDGLLERTRFPRQKCPSLKLKNYWQTFWKLRHVSTDETCLFEVCTAFVFVSLFFGNKWKKILTFSPIFNVQTVKIHNPHTNCIEIHHSEYITLPRSLDWLRKR